MYISIHIYIYICIYTHASSYYGSVSVLLGRGAGRLWHRGLHRDGPHRAAAVAAPARGAHRGHLQVPRGEQLAAGGSCGAPKSQLRCFWWNVGKKGSTLRKEVFMGKSQFFPKKLTKRGEMNEETPCSRKQDLVQAGSQLLGELHPFPFSLVGSFRGSFF